MISFVFGLLIGLVVTGLFEAILYFVLGKEFWHADRVFLGYKIHHSVVGALAILCGLVLGINLFWIGIGIGIIVMHTITDGRLVFIERK